MQSSSSSTRSRASITANLGVSLGILRRWEEPEVAEAAPHYSAAHWLRRIGELVGDRTDRWWTIHADGPATDGEEFVEAILKIGMPAVRHRMSAAVIRDEWLAGPTTATPNLKRLRYLLVLLHEIGPRDRISDVAAELRARASFDEFWQAKAEATISRLESESRMSS